MNAAREKARAEKNNIAKGAARGRPVPTPRDHLERESRGADVNKLQRFLPRFVSYSHYYGVEKSRFITIIIIVVLVPVARTYNK